MTTKGSHSGARRAKRWILAFVGTAVFHGAVLFILAWTLRPDPLVRVISVVPPYDQTVELFPAQAIAPVVFLSAGSHDPTPEAAALYRVEPSGERVLLSRAHRHPEKSSALQFDPVDTDGAYEIVVEESVVSAPFAFDGEPDSLPSGDGKPGGRFVSAFSVVHKSHEVMTASLYDPDKPMANEEPAQKSVESSAPQTVQPPTPPTPPRKSTKRPPKSSPETPKSPIVQENVSPVPALPTDNTAPAPLTPQSLRVSPLNLAPSLLAQSADTARQIFEERDTNTFVQAANLAKKRHDAAYNADGPVIGPGQEGNSLSHQKDVAEYLALMHKEIHPLWAHGFLLRLDTIYRRPGDRINNPDLEAVLEITLDSLGKVTDVRMVRSSGITEYDSEAIHVAWNSSPGLPIPGEMRSPNGKAYIHWTFWRDSRQCGVFGVKVFKYEGSRRDSLDFSLKAVQLQEKKLGLTPSSIPGRTSSRPTAPETPLPEKINPLED